MNDGKDDQPPLDYQICNEEKIHLIGQVQGHGAFLAINLPDLRVVLASENASGFLGKQFATPSQIIGSRLEELFSDGLSKEILTRARQDLLSASSTYFEWHGKVDYDLFLFALSPDRLGVEITPYFAPRVLRGNLKRKPEEHLRYFLQEMKNAKTLETFGQIACRSVRLLTGLERVMLYRFTPDWNGDVIAEDRAVSVPSFLHHKFPASDIPKPARDLYLRNQVRFIYDSREVASPLLPLASQNQKNELDLTDSRLRAVSPYHIEYLKNMNVTTSFSVAIVVEGKLWGLIACHGQQRTYIPHHVRSLCQTLSDTVALAANLLEARNHTEVKLEFQLALQSLFSRVRAALRPLSEFFKALDAVNSIFGSHGYAVVTAEKIDFAGICPPSKDLRSIYERLFPLTGEGELGVLAIDHLAELNPTWENLNTVASGVLCANLPDEDKGLLMIFRGQQLEVTTWGGDPRKRSHMREYQGAINPRASFESWTETVKNRSRKWLPFEIEGIQTLRTFIFDTIVRDQTVILELSERLNSRKNTNT